MGGGGVVRVEIQARLEFVEGAIVPRAHLLIGKTDGAGSSVHVAVFDRLRPPARRQSARVPANATKRGNRRLIGLSGRGSLLELKC